MLRLPPTTWKWTSTRDSTAPYPTILQGQTISVSKNRTLTTETTRRYTEQPSSTGHSTSQGFRSLTITTWMFSRRNPQTTTRKTDQSEQPTTTTCAFFGQRWIHPNPRKTSKIAFGLLFKTSNYSRRKTSSSFSPNQGNAYWQPTRPTRTHKEPSTTGVLDFEQPFKDQENETPMLRLPPTTCKWTSTRDGTTPYSTIPQGQTISVSTNRTSTTETTRSHTDQPSITEHLTSQGLRS